MNCFIGIGLLCIVSGIVAVDELDVLNAHRYRRAVCDDKYSEIDPNHSMCLTDVGQDVPLTAAEKEAIVDKHNLLRQVQGDGQPAASNMQKVVWDEEIAKVASKWVRQCGSGSTAHEPSSDRRAVPSLPGVLIGQNAASGFTTFEDAIQAWYDEVKDFSYGVGSTNGGVIGHYTQVVNSNVARIGCGKALCNGRYHYVCDYARGQMTPEMKAPYKSGSAAAECPNKVDDTGKLCDCNGLICLNGGTIDLSTCSCACESLYKGSQCGELNCPVEDGSYCGSGYLPSYCDLYSNVPTECPYMCGICKVGTSCDKICQNGGVLDSNACKCTCVDGYSGDECETDVCSRRDHFYCPRLNIQPSNCNNIVKRICPTKCGLCGNTASQCQLQCYNGGVLDQVHCACQCPFRFWGEQCQYRRF